MEEAEINYFFDSYAIIEIINGNQNYLRFTDESITITLFNLAEIYYHVLNNYPLTEALDFYNKYRNAVVEVDDETLKEAIKFRKEHKKQDLSYTDCIGYIYAKKHNMKFLTGDKEFENLENVEFVK